MDALVMEALKKVNETVDAVNRDKAIVRFYTKETVARAVNAVDALKSALKAL